jgi:hypothetical protein
VIDPKGDQKLRTVMMDAAERMKCPSANGPRPGPPSTTPSTGATRPKSPTRRSPGRSGQSPTTAKGRGGCSAWR